MDSLGYLSLEGMLAAAGGPDRGFCHACFSGDYVIPVEEVTVADPQLPLFDAPAAVPADD